jgi:hypothetical protein
MTIRKFLLGAALALASSMPAQAAEFHQTPSGVWIDGEIARGDADRFAGYTARYPAGLQRCCLGVCPFVRP